MSPQGNFPQYFPQYVPQYVNSPSHVYTPGPFDPYVPSWPPKKLKFIPDEPHHHLQNPHLTFDCHAMGNHVSDSAIGPSPGGPYNPHAAAPMGQPYTPMSGNPAGYGRGDPSAGWAPQPGTYPPNQYGAYHG